MQQNKEEGVYTHPLYWDTQVQAIVALKNIGIEYKINDRIAIMQVYRIFDKFWKTKEAGIEERRKAVEVAQQAMEDLLILRLSGYEPNHEKGKYIDEPSA